MKYFRKMLKSASAPTNCRPNDQPLKPQSMTEAQKETAAPISALGVSVIPAPQPSPDQQIADALFCEIHRAVTDSFQPAAPESSKTFDHGRVERAISHYRRFIDAVSERIRSELKETALPGV